MVRDSEAEGSRYGGESERWADGAVVVVAGDPGYSVTVMMEVTISRHGSGGVGGEIGTPGMPVPRQRVDGLGLV